MFKTQVRVSFQYFFHPLIFHFHYKTNIFKICLEQEEPERIKEKIGRHLKKKIIKKAEVLHGHKKRGYFGGRVTTIFKYFYIRETDVFWSTGTTAG